MVEEGTTFQVKIPAGVKMNEHYDWDVVTISDNAINKKTELMKRKEALLAELAEIEKQLENEETV